MKRGLTPTIVRFATVGLVNTAIDLVLFWLLHAPLGILAGELRVDLGRYDVQLPGQRPPHLRSLPDHPAPGACCSWRTNGFTMWLLQPLLIHAAYDAASIPLMGAKVVALGGQRGRELPALPVRGVAARGAGRRGCQLFDCARRSRRSSGGSAKMSDSSALCTASASG